MAADVYRTALAESELEYRTDHVSSSVYVRIPLTQLPAGLKSLTGKTLTFSFLSNWLRRVWVMKEVNSCIMRNNFCGKCKCLLWVHVSCQSTTVPGAKCKDDSFSHLCHPVCSSRAFAMTRKYISCFPLYVHFNMCSNDFLVTCSCLGSGNDVYIVIWTTTPWTLPANKAVCYGPGLR